MGSEQREEGTDHAVAVTWRRPTPIPPARPCSLPPTPDLDLFDSSQSRSPAESGVAIAGMRQGCRFRRLGRLFIPLSRLPCWRLLILPPASPPLVLPFATSQPGCRCRESDAWRMAGQATEPSCQVRTAAYLPWQCQEQRRQNLSKLGYGGMGRLSQSNASVRYLAYYAALTSGRSRRIL